MTLSFKFLGYEWASIELDIEPDAPSPTPIVAKGVKGISKLWLKGMTR